MWLTVGNGDAAVRILGSSNDGRTFRPLGADQPEISCSTLPTSSQVVWLTCSGGMLTDFARSSDGGRRFVRLSFTGGGTAGTAMWPVDASLAFFRTVGGDAGGLYRSTDTGRTFSALPPLPRAFGTDGVDIDDLTFADPRCRLALTSDGDLFRTADGGTTWSTVRL